MFSLSLLVLLLVSIIPSMSQITYITSPHSTPPTCTLLEALDDAIIHVVDRHIEVYNVHMAWTCEAPYDVDDTIDNIRRMHAHNIEILSRLSVDATKLIGNGDVLEMPEPPDKIYTVPQNILAHLVRDHGRGDFTYFTSRIPSNSTVLVPGAGVGGLVLSLAGNGCEIEANEGSFHMASILAGVLRMAKGGGMVAHVYLRPYGIGLGDEIKGGYIEDGGLEFSLPHMPDLIAAVVHSDFISHYMQTTANFDVVATSYFIDVLPLHPVIITINNVLRNGGLWVNKGPLHYHKTADYMPDAGVVRRAVEGHGFEVLEWEVLEIEDYVKGYSVGFTRVEGFRPIGFVARKVRDAGGSEAIRQGERRMKERLKSKVVFDDIE